MMHILSFCVFAMFQVAFCSSQSRIIPPVYDYDEFVQCSQKHFAADFCYVKVVTKSEDPLRIGIESSNRIVTGFRRNLLEHGICVPDCEREVAALSDSDRKRLNCERFPVAFRHIYSTSHWQDKLEPYVQKYGELINICVNNRLERRYNLSYHGFSQIEYCVSNRTTSTTVTDLPLICFLAVLFTLAVTLVTANLVDLLGNSSWNDHIIVSSCSIRRNWASFTTPSKSQLHENLGFIEGLRFFVNSLILVGHCILLSFCIPVDNPEEVEVFISNVCSLLSTACCVSAVQFFFMISGLMLMVNFLRDVQQKPKLEPGYIRSKIINRMIRLFPVYYLFLFSACVGAVLPKLELGVVGYHYLIREQEICRTNWWTNVLMINNLPIFENLCFIHGWYMAADFQLYMAGLLFLITMLKYPSVTKYLLWILVVLSVVFPAALFSQLTLESVLGLRLR